jgi:hypothetical protein
MLSPLPAPGEDISFVSSSSVVIEGRTRVDAAVTVQDSFAELDEDGLFAVTVGPLDEGFNLIEVVVSLATGEEESIILIVSYDP